MTSESAGCEIAAPDPGVTVLSRPDAMSEKMTLHVLIVYEDPVAARRALHAASRLAAQTAGQVEFHREFCRFDLLEDRACAVLAAEEARRADLIIVATRTADDLPPTVNRWLADCLAQRDQTDTAVLALLGSGEAWNLSLEDEGGFRVAHRMGAPKPSVDADAPEALLPVSV